MEGRACLRIALIPRPVVLPGHVYILKEVQISQGPVERLRSRLLAQSENVPFLQSENVPLMVMNWEGFGDGVWSVDDERWRA